MKRPVFAEQDLLSFVEAENASDILDRTDFRERKIRNKVSIGRLKRKNKSENITHYTCPKDRFGFGRKNSLTSVRAYTKGIVSSMICGGLRLDHETSHEFLSGPTIYRKSSD